MTRFPRLPVVRSRIAAAAVFASLALSTLALAVEPLETHMTPPDQPPIQAIDGRDLTPVKELFNRDAARIRIFVLLSPT